MKYGEWERDLSEADEGITGILLKRFRLGPRGLIRTGETEGSFGAEGSVGGLISISFHSKPERQHCEHFQCLEPCDSALGINGRLY